MPSESSLSNVELDDAFDAADAQINDDEVRLCHGASSGLTTQAQRPGPRDAMIANHDAPPGSLQRMVSLRS